MSDPYVVFFLRETTEDLNGDGDFSDNVLQVYNVDQARLFNSGIAGLGWFEIDDDWIVFDASEAAQAADLNA